MEWLTYLLKVSVCTTFFFGFYLLGLRKLTFFRINRFYLLITLGFSFAIPALQFNIQREMVQEIQAEAIVNVPPDEAGQLDQLPFKDLKLVYAEPVQHFDWLSVAPYAYLLVTTILLLLFCWKLFKLIAHARYAQEKINGLRLVSKPTGFTNCSFFNYVFINKESLSGEDLNVLLRHEQVHARQLHSIDKILLIVLKAVLWFNPIIYLYDRALEQNHEYEADELSAAGIGNHAYAGLLLKLAVSGNTMPLVHNFVKSPVKDRIKMMFNSKSRNMKKFSYVLALPLSLLLMWVFSVQIVYAENNSVAEKAFQDVLLTQAPKTKEIALPNVKRNDPYLKSEDYRKKEKLSKAASGKTLTGKLGADYVSGKKHQLIRGRLFTSEGNTYVISPLGKPDFSHLPAQTEVSVEVTGSVITKDDPYIGIMPKKMLKGDQLVYEMPKPERYPFLYEANKVRFNDGRIQSISNTGEGKELIVQANGYSFKLSVDPTQTNPDLLNAYKKGDSVRLRFVHEVKTGDNAYAVKDWVSITKNIRTFGVRNMKLFGRFYKENGFQRVVATGTSRKADGHTFKIVSYDQMNSDASGMVTKLNKAVVEVAGNVLQGEEIVYDKHKATLTAKKASICKAGSMVVSTLIIYNLNTGVYTSDFDSGRISGSNLENNVAYTANSARMGRDQSTLHLYGNASLNYKDKRVTGSSITYNSKRDKIQVKDAVFYSGNEKGVYADSMNIDMNSPKIKAFGTFGVKF